MKMKKSLLFLVAIMMLFVITLTGCGKSTNNDSKEIDSNEYEAPLSKYFEGLVSGNLQLLLEATPEFDRPTDSEYMQKSLDNLLETFTEEYGENLKVSVNYTNKTAVESEKLELIQKYIKTSYDVDVKVEAGYLLDFEATIKGDKEEDTDSDSAYVYKIDGNWYYYDMDPEDASDYLAED